MMKNEAVDFAIVSRPTHITLYCPHCGNKVRIPWDLVDVPDCWGDDWGEVFCPECLKEIKLGEYEYD